MIINIIIYKNIISGKQVKIKLISQNKKKLYFKMNIFISTKIIKKKIYNTSITNCYYY